MPKVSIILPVYNTEAYLKECLDSVVNQTLKDIEIICVDDGSNDNSGKILDEYANEDKRIRVIHKVNSGYGNSMNIGMSKAQGEYIGIVEPDDYIDFKMFEMLYDIANKYNVDIVKSNFYEFRTNSGKKLIKLDTSGDLYNKVIDLQNDLTPFFFNEMNTWCGIYRREYIEKNNIKHNETPGASYQDQGFWFQTFMYANNIYVLDDAFYMYRCDNPNSSVKNKEKVYVIKEEYDFIKDIISKKQELYDKYIKVYNYHKFINYRFNFKRIADEYKEEFLAMFCDEMKQANDNNELDYSMFTKKQLKQLKLLLCNLQKFKIEVQQNLTFLQKIFSITNRQNYKVLTILGFSMNISERE